MLSEKYKNILIVSGIIMAILCILLTGYVLINKIRLSGNMKDANEFVSNFSNLVEENKTEIKYKETLVAGIMIVPNINLKVPILNEVIANMEEAIIVVSGAGINNVGNTVIVGQSYLKNTAFYDLENLKINDEIHITDTKGITKNYTIYDIYETAKEDKKYITENSKGNTRITLITNKDNEILVVQADAK